MGVVARGHHIGGGVAMGGVRRDLGDSNSSNRRMDPRTKYSHLKIKPKGSSSPNQSSSILKRMAPPEDPPSSSPTPPFKIPKLLQDSAALDRPMDARDLFKGVEGMGEAGGYDAEVSSSFGMFKSNFFPRSQEGAGQPFGEITLDEALPERDAELANSNERVGGVGDKQRIEGAGETDESSLAAVSPPRPPPVPSYLAQLDVGGLGNDLKIDSAFGSLAGKCEGGGDSNEKGGESQARKLPSMFGLGF